MRTEDELVVVDAYLDRAWRHLRSIDPACCVPPATRGERPERFSVLQQVRWVCSPVDRARAYVLAARQTVGDVADDVACGMVAEVGADLCLLERQCAMVDELSGLSARFLAAWAQARDREAAGDQSGQWSADLSSIVGARTSARAAGQLAARLAGRPTAAARAHGAS